MTLQGRATGGACVALALGILAPPPPLLGQSETVRAEIVGIVVDSESFDSSTDVRISRFEDFSEEERIDVGTTLAVGDMLTSLTGTIGIELSCGEETTLRFADRFKVLINSPEESDCALNFLSGSLDVITDQPTEVDAGAVILGSEGTQYSVELTIEDGEHDRTLLVFDGKVRVRGEDIDDEVETGSTWNQRRGLKSWGRIDETHLDRVSLRYAVFDASRMKPESGESREAAVARFKQLHYQVLEKPEDSSKRGELAQEQLKIQRTPQAYYHLRRGKITTSDELSRYQIDAGVATLLKASTRATVLTAPSQQNLTVLRQPDPFALIQEKKFKEAIEILMAVEKKTSRTYYGLARSFLGLQGPSSDRAAHYAGLALKLAASDRELTRDQAAECRRLQSSHQRQR